MNRPNAAMAVSAECFPNIAERGRRRRRFKGWVGVALGVAVLAALWLGHAPPLEYLLLTPIAGFAALCFFQAKEKT